MSVKLLVQLGLSSSIFLFSTMIVWYEGSSFIDNPWEWKHTALFSQWLNGQVNDSSDLVQIDYLLYAAKFAPTYPIIMLLSSIYFLITSNGL